MPTPRPILVHLSTRTVTHFWEDRNGRGWGVVILRVLVDGKPGSGYALLINENDMQGAP